MWRPARLLGPLGLAVLVVAAAAPSADPGDPKGAPALGRGQRPPRPQDIDPARVDLKQGFRTHQIVEIQNALDRVDREIAALQQLIADLQREKAKELQHREEVKEHIVRIKTLPPPNDLARWESELERTEDRIDVLDRKIAAAREKLDAKRAEKNDLKRELRDAKQRREREQRDGKQEAEQTPAQTPSALPREAD